MTKSGTYYVLFYTHMNLIKLLIEYIVPTKLKIAMKVDKQLDRYL